MPQSRFSSHITAGPDSSGLPFLPSSRSRFYTPSPSPPKTTRFWEASPRQVRSKSVARASKALQTANPCEAEKRRRRLCEERETSDAAISVLRSPSPTAAYPDTSARKAISVLRSPNPPPPSSLRGRRNDPDSYRDGNLCPPKRTYLPEATNVRDRRLCEAGGTTAEAISVLRSPSPHHPLQPLSKTVLSIIYVLCTKY